MLEDLTSFLGDAGAAFGQAAASIALLAPLILGLLPYWKDKKKSNQEAEAPAAAAVQVTMGETVDFESVAVQSLRGQITLLERENQGLNAQLADRREQLLEVRRQRDAARNKLTEHGLTLP